MNVLKGLIPSQLGIVVYTTVLTGCFAGPGFLKQNEAFQIQEAAVSIQSLGEVTQGTVSATSMTTQTLTAAAGSSIAGVKLSVQPGTFNLNASIALEESATLADGIMSQNLGLTLSSTAGKAVSISAQGLGTAELAKPMTLAIPLGVTSLMLADSDMILVIVYRTHKDGEILDGVIPPEKIAVRNGQVIFDIIRWGAYQPAYVPKAEETKVAAVQDIKSEAKIITATAMKELPKATITALKIAKGDNRGVTFSATLQNADIKACYFDAYDTKSNERHFEELATPSIFFDFSRDYEAMAYKVRIGCSLLDGRVLETAYTLFELPAVDRPPESNGSGGSSGNPMPPCDYTEMNPCTEGLEYVRFVDAAGAPVSTIAAYASAYVEVKFAAGYDINFDNNNGNNLTTYCLDVSSVSQRFSRMHGGCHPWELVDEVNNIHRRPFMAHKRGVNNDAYRMNSIRFQDMNGKVYGYFLDWNNASASTYWNSNVVVASFTYTSSYGLPVDMVAPTLTAFTASGSSISLNYDDDENTDPLRMFCMTLSKIDVPVDEFMVCPSSSGGVASISPLNTTYLGSLASRTVLAGTYYVSAISMEDSASNYLGYFSNAPGQNFFYYDENMVLREVANTASTSFSVTSP